jgi:hypothetical protein
MAKGNMPRTKYPKLRAWAKPTRKIMTMVIPSEKDKLSKHEVRKKIERDEIEEALKGHNNG